MDEIVRIQRATVAEHIREENAHNWPAVHNTFVQDDTAFYDVIPLNMRFPGIAGVKNFYQAAHTAFPDFQIDVWAEYDMSGCSIREVTISGTHEGDWCGVGGTGRQVNFHLLGVFLFAAGDSSGKILAERVYFDNLTVRQQLQGTQEASSVPHFAA